MKTTITVSFSRSVEIEIDPSKLNDRAYIVNIQDSAVALAADEINMKCGNITDAECDGETIHELID